MDKAERRLLTLAEQQLPHILRQQILDRDHAHYGGICRGTTGRTSAENGGGTPAQLITMVCLYLHPESRYYRNAQLLQPMLAAAQFVRSSQRRDGLLSMDGCNFDSPPDTAFVVVGWAELYRLLRQHNAPELQPLEWDVETFLATTESGLVHGGAHTPNHRWVMTAALLLLAQITSSTDAQSRAHQWLAEGVDCSADGLWTERSNGIYNVTCNLMFWQIAQCLQDDAFLEPIRRNLDSITRQIHPNGMLVTDYSRRQDRSRVHYMDNYYLPLRLMAGHDSHGQWAWWSDWAVSLLGTYGPYTNGAYGHELLYHMRYPQWMNIPHLERQEPVMRYQVGIEPAGKGHRILRHRQHTASLTLVSERDTIGSFYFGGARLTSIRPTAAFFGKAQLQPDYWQRASDGSYWTEIVVEAPYFEPLSPADIHSLPQAVNPLDLYHSQRRHTDICRLVTQIHVVPKDQGFDLQWTIEPSEPTWEIMSQLALEFGAEGQWHPHYGLRLLDQGTYLMEDSCAVYQNGPWIIEVQRTSPKRVAHFLPILRGDEPRSQGNYLLLNGISSEPTSVMVRAYEAGVN